MSNCPYCGLFRYDLSGCICSEQEYHSVWNRGNSDESLTNGTSDFSYTAKRTKWQTDL